MLRSTLSPATRAGFLIVSLIATQFAFSNIAAAQLSQIAKSAEVPESLAPWKGWVMWGADHHASPATYKDQNKRIRFWPSELSLDATNEQGQWSLSLQAFTETWVPLPGDSTLWPQNVKLDGEPVVVVEHGGHPAVELRAGQHKLSGDFRWQTMPQSIPIPPAIGLLSLQVEGKEVDFPKWDSGGSVWLKRRSEPQEKNLLTAQVYRVIEDGIPMWLRTDIELKVSGKSREEDLGWVLPVGWKLANVESPLPIAVDEKGQAKAQVRAGTWTVTLNAFRTDDLRKFTYADDARPITDNELIGFRSKPEFRVAELTELRPVDVNQTTWPAKWRGLPTYQWETNTGFGLDEKMRGRGMQRREGLGISRTIWLDEDGQAATFHDQLGGQGQERWRLDVATGQELGVVRINQTAQLITENPESGDRGVEVRFRNMQVSAVSRGAGSGDLLATGWQADADSLELTWNLPPGWRVLAMFGADRVEGDWLTAWSLLDLFLLLIFSLAIFRVFGFWAGLLAFLAFGLAYHEPNSPRLTWLLLLVPVALLKVVPAGTARKTMQVWKYVALALLVLHLAPFITAQIQTALFPQLERAGTVYGTRRSSNFRVSQVREAARQGRTDSYRDQLHLDNTAAPLGMNSEETSANKVTGMGRGMNMGTSGKSEGKMQLKKPSRFSTSNMLQMSKARIQTGPAQPTWSWNRVQCYWDGPVSASQRITPVFITRNQHRILNVIRIALLIGLVYVMSGMALPRRRTKRKSKATAKSVAATASVIFGLLMLSPGQTVAQEFPSQSMLEQLRSRLIDSSDAFPNAADIASVELAIDGNRVTMTSKIHAAAKVAVPLPGKLPTWSPVSVQVDGQPAKLVCRREKYLWVALEPGVHEVTVESLLPKVADWEWTFLLKPRFVSVVADGWKVTGVGTDGVPEQQLFFSRQQQATPGTAAYDQKDFNSIVAIDRHIETGLIWQVRTTATRLSNTGKAISVRVPLMPGESVLSSDVKVEDGFVLIRMAADASSVSWSGDLPIGKAIQMTAPDTDQWIERWHLVTSPVWNVSIEGLEPIFESSAQHLIPVWLPWPGEQVKLSFSQPAAVPGETMTVQKVTHSTNLGSRQRKGKLEIDLECSLGGDFPITFPAAAQIESVHVGQREIPVRLSGQQLVIPVEPGRQKLKIEWRSEQPLQITERPAEISLPCESANIGSVINVQASRWVLWTDGPIRGPAVQFWVILAFALLAALVLGSVSWSPLSRLQWVLLVLGLTQVPVIAGMLVVGWLFLLGWRGQHDSKDVSNGVFNIIQVLIALLTIVSLGILVMVVSEGLLGRPEMFIRGNGSSQNSLQWFQPHATSLLPQPIVISTSVWIYRLLMLFWALWLASALLRWLTNGWQVFSKGGYWRAVRKRTADVVVDATTVDAE